MPFLPCVGSVHGAAVAFQAGGFYSAEDADSYPTAKSKVKQEGAFCVWTAEEIRALLPDPLEGDSDRKTLADIFMHHYGVKEGGNVSPLKVSWGRWPEASGKEGLRGTLDSGPH